MRVKQASGILSAVRVAKLLLIAVLVAGCGGADDEPEPTPAGTAQATPAGEATRTATPAEDPVRAIATDLEVPWGLAFLPDGDALVAERTTGRILRIREDGEPREAMEVPGVDTAAGEGGLLGLAVSPRYARDRLVYAYFTSADDNRIVRFELGGEVEPILTGLQRSGIHNGGRIAFGPDGKLYAGVGDAAQPDLAQDRGSPNGKILRIDPDGGIPRDNPFPDSPVWSLGHRNVQGLTWDDEGRMWAAEFGQNAFDEINRIRPGRNYGWPEVEGEGGGGSFEDPLVTWSTDEASPSGIAYAGGALYVGALRGEGVWRVPLRGARTGAPRLIHRGYGRVRTVEPAPDGGLWITTSNRDGRGSPRDGDDRIVRIPVR